MTRTEPNADDGGTDRPTAADLEVLVEWAEVANDEPTESESRPTPGRPDRSAGKVFVHEMHGGLPSGEAFIGISEDACVPEGEWR